jgi:hypothetical protein
VDGEQYANAYSGCSFTGWGWCFSLYEKAGEKKARAQ